MCDGHLIVSTIKIILIIIQTPSLPWLQEDLSTQDPSLQASEFSNLAGDRLDSESLIFTSELLNIVFIEIIKQSTHIKLN